MATAEYQRAWREKNKERARLYEQRYQAKHPEYKVIKDRRYKQRHPRFKNEAKNIRIRIHAEAIMAMQEAIRTRLLPVLNHLVPHEPPPSALKMPLYRLTHKEKLHAKVFEMYGDHCAYCGFDDKRALHLDHIQDNGAEHRRQISDGAHGVWRDAIKEYRPDLYQILCANCNLIKLAEFFKHRREVKQARLTN